MCRPSHAWLKCGSKAAWDSRGAWDTREGEQRASRRRRPSAVSASDSALMQTFPSSPAGAVVLCSSAG